GVTHRKFEICNSKTETRGTCRASPGTCPLDLVIGVDLDNTLICYDEVFHRAACEEGLIAPAIPKSKEQVRNTIRRLPKGERRWTRLQALVYGRKMQAARLFAGAAQFLRHGVRSRTRVLIVSHRTHYAKLDGVNLDLRQPARAWLEAQGFFKE